MSLAERTDMDATCTSIDMQKVTEFCELKRRKEELDEQLKSVNSLMRAVEAQLLDMFAEAGVPKISTKEYGTLYVQRQLWAGPKEGNKAALVEFLKSYQPALVSENVNSQTLSAFVRDITDNGEKELPQGLGAVVEVKEQYSMRLRKA